jgi:adenosylcobinamide kinase/adenosylcobinamide-phosphate guanylyltransferase
VASRLVLVLGGVRSGKSAFAERLAGDLGQNILYVATGVGFDAEMVERIRRHRQSRPADWSTLEEPLELGKRVAEHFKEGHSFGGVLIDSLDLWVANLILEHEQETKETAEARVAAAARSLLDVIQRSTASFVLVSSEVGNSLVPPDPLGRRFQDIMGLVNQRVAAAADQVYVIVAGIPTVIKP